MKKIIGAIAISVGVLILICYMLCTPAQADDGYSTLPGWSAGYRLYLDIANFDHFDDDLNKLRLFGKYKQTNGNVVKFGIDGSSDSAVLFFEQEFKF